MGFYLPFLSFLQKHRLVKYILIGVLVTSCAVQTPVSNIYYKDHQTGSLHQWPLITDETNHYVVQVEPLENVHEMMLFDVSVTNKSDEKIIVDPGAWGLSYLDRSGSSIDTSYVPMSGKQINNSYQRFADKMDKARKQENVAFAITAAVVLVAFVIVVAAFAGGDDDEDEEDEDEEDSFTINFGIASGSEDAGWSRKDEIKYLRRLGKEMKHANFEPLELTKGETDHFTLFFPREQSKHIVLDGRISDDLLSWRFKHAVSEVERYP